MILGMLAGLVIALLTTFVFLYITHSINVKYPSHQVGQFLLVVLEIQGALGGQAAH